MQVSKLFLAVTLLFLTVSAGVADQTVEQLIQEFTGQAPAQKRTPAELRAACVRVLDELLPGMGAESIVERETPQQTFEKICFRAGRPGAEAERTALCQAMIVRLGRDTPKPARIWLLRQLERLGGYESVVVLAFLIYDEDPQIRELTRRALQANSAFEAADVLRTALAGAKDPEWEIALINALGAGFDVYSVLLLNRRAEEGSPPVVSAVIAALGDIADNRAVAMLERLWRTGPAALRGDVTDARLRGAEVLIVLRDKKQAGEIYEELFTSAEAVHIRMAALRGLAAVRGAELLPKLLEVIANDDAEFELRALAVSLAAETPGEQVTATLVERLCSTGISPVSASATAQVLLLGALAERGDTPARPAVTKLLESKSEDVRVAAVRALLTLGDRTSVLPLARAAADAGDAERDAARRSLARLRGDDVDRTILSGLEQAAPKLRVELIRSLGARWCREAVPVLFEQAAQREESVRVAAIEALGGLGTEPQAPGLLELLQSAESEAVRAAAEDAVVAVCGRIADPEARAEPVLAVWDDAPGGVRPALVRVLGRVRGGAALVKIRAARKSDDPEVVDATVRALAKWPEAEVLDDLLDIAQHSKNKAHRVLALQGHVRLLELPSQREPRASVEMYENAMSLAERPEERKLVLSGLAKVNHLDALRAAQRHLADETLRAEAEAAVIAAAQLVGPLHRTEARAAIEAVLGKTTSDATRQAGKQALAVLRKTAGYIAACRVAGPYFDEGREWTHVFDNTYPPELPDAQGVAWRPLQTTSVKEPWIFDLTRLDDGGQRCVYVRAAVWSEEAREARLEVGSDDAVKVWLNERLVHEARVTRGHTPFQDKVPVRLESGWNTLLLKVVQVGGAWSFSCGVATPDGEAPEGLKFRAESPPK